MVGTCGPIESPNWTNDCGRAKDEHLEMNGMATCSNSFPIKLRYSKNQVVPFRSSSRHAQSKECFYCKNILSSRAHLPVQLLHSSPCAASCVLSPSLLGQTYDVRFGNALLELKSSRLWGSRFRLSESPKFHHVQHVCSRWIGGEASKHWI